jgi:hypothetical protein
MRAYSGGNPQQAVEETWEEIVRIWSSLYDVILLRARLAVRNGSSALFLVQYGGDVGVISETYSGR